MSSINWKDKYTEYQMLMQQMQQLEQNSEILEKHINDLVLLKENLESFSKTNKGTESLIPLGNGIFLKGEIKDTENVIMNVGSGVCVEKSVEDADKTISDQLLEVSNVLIQVKAEVENTRHTLMELQQEFEKMSKEKLNE